MPGSKVTSPPRAQVPARASTGGGRQTSSAVRHAEAPSPRRADLPGRREGLRGSRSLDLAVPLILAAPTARLDPSARRRAEAAAQPHASVGRSGEPIVRSAARAAVSERPKPSRVPE